MVGVNRLYYFAYGSNMSRAQMRSRVPQAHALPGEAWLLGYQLVFACYGVTAPADVRRSQVVGAAVLGRLYGIDVAGLRRLDEFEDVPSVYQRREVRVLYRGTENLPAVVYVRSGKPALGDPQPAYLTQIQKEYRALGYELEMPVPKEFVRRLR